MLVDPDPVQGALATSATLREIDPCWAGSAAVVAAVELLLLARADGVPVVAAGRPFTEGDPVTVLDRAARDTLERVDAAEDRWFAVGRALVEHDLPGRMTAACWDAAGGGVLTNSAYRMAVAAARGRPLREQQASRDLRALVDAGLLRPTGATRDREYRWRA